MIFADVFVMAGVNSPAPSPIIIEKQEIFAPVMNSLFMIGSPASIDNDNIVLMTPNGVLTMQNDKVNAIFNEKPIVLSNPPRLIDNIIYLPMRALSSYLNVNVSFDSASHSLSISPIVTLGYEPLGNGTAITVRSTAPISYSSGYIKGTGEYGTPRYFYNLKGVSLGYEEQQIAVDESTVARMRASQFSVSPPITRLVIDLTGVADVKPVISENGQLLTINIKSINIVKPPIIPSIIDILNPVVENQPLNITDITYTKKSENRSDVSITTDNKPRVTASYNNSENILTLIIPDVVDIPAPISIASGDIIKSIQVEKKEKNAIIQIKCDQNAGYLVRRGNNGIIISLGKFTIQDMRVVLDPGHGGNQSGAVGYRQTLEKSINLDVMLRVAKLLRQEKVSVFLTRDKDVRLELSERTIYASSVNADIFVSVHCNSSGKRNSGAGTQTYFTHEWSAILAGVMHEELNKSLNLKDSGIHLMHFYVTRKTTMPSVLLELAYINNYREEALLLTPGFRQSAAEGIVNGIKKYAAKDDWKMRRLVIDDK
jgi:N-acetylmuramoyl-L-alanine amidase